MIEILIQTFTVEYQYIECIRTKKIITKNELKEFRKHFAG